MPELPVFLEQEEVGCLHWQTEGNAVLLRASCPFEEGMIYRLHLRQGSEDLYLGVMLPENDRFVLQKRLPQNKCAPWLQTESARAHILRHRPGESEPVLQMGQQEAPFGPLPFAFSQMQPVPDSDDFIGSICHKAGGRQIEWEGMHYYAAPVSIGAELPLAPFFCLLTFFTWREQSYAAFCVDGEGKPCPLPGQPE